MPPLTTVKPLVLHGDEVAQLGSSEQLTDGSNRAYVTSNLLTPLNQALLGANGGYSNLLVTDPSSTVVNITADMLVLSDGSNPLALTGVNVSINIASGNGAGHLDTGSVTTGWYYFWVIAKSDGTVDGLASTEKDAWLLTRPAGYDFARLVGAMRYSSGFPEFYQLDDECTYKPNVPFISKAFSASTASVDLSTLVPPIARAVTFQMHMRNSSTTELYLQVSNISTAGRFYAWQYATFNGQACATQVYRLPLLTPQTFWYQNAGVSLSAQGFYVQGFTLPI